ncbi:hypothetical protein [Corynebacterium glyciniphilum]
MDVRKIIVPLLCRAAAGLALLSALWTLFWHTWRADHWNQR